MKLVPKLTTALIACTFAVLVAKAHVRWLDGMGAGKDTMDASALRDLAPGESLSRIASTAAGEERLTDVPVSIGGLHAGMIELAEPLDAEERAVHRIVVDTVGTTLTLALVNAALSIILGFWFVGRPIRGL